MDSNSNSQTNLSVPVVKVDDLYVLNDLVTQFISCGFPVLVFDNNLTVDYLNKDAEELLIYLHFQ